MSSTSDSITWQGWSQKWGDWTTWFRNATIPLEPIQRGLFLPPPGVERLGQNVRTGREMLTPDQPSTQLE